MVATTTYGTELGNQADFEELFRRGVRPHRRELKELDVSLQIHYATFDSVVGEAAHLVTSHALTSVS